MSSSPCRQLVAIGMNNKRLIIIRTDNFSIISETNHDEDIYFIKMSTDHLLFGNNKGGTNTLKVLPLMANSFT